MIRSHSVTAIICLCPFGVDVNWKSSKGGTAVHIADQERQPAICRLLIDEGADLRAVTRFGFTPLELTSGRHLVDLQRETAQLIREVSWPRRKKCMIAMMFFDRSVMEQERDSRGGAVHTIPWKSSGV
jgi:ankyrin repeat protein